MRHLLLGFAFACLGLSFFNLSRQDKQLMWPLDRLHHPEEHASTKIVRNVAPLLYEPDADEAKGS